MRNRGQVRSLRNQSLKFFLFLAFYNNFPNQNGKECIRVYCAIYNLRKIVSELPDHRFALRA
jgi:hypothetical protein